MDLDYMYSILCVFCILFVHELLMNPFTTTVILLYV